ncbi:MAG: hypothetical protein KY475_13790 [Planctomycetes bacterium]|nr:hypothetical protein [Planctomycetota bacterium]
MQFFLHIVLVACLVICPFNCLGASLGGSAQTSVGARSCCAHCGGNHLANRRDHGPDGTTADRQPHPLPGFPRDDGCCQCLCQGAIADSAVPELDVCEASEELIPLHRNPADSQARLLLAVGRDVSPIPALGDCRFNGGRVYRLLIESLLI